MQPVPPSACPNSLLRLMVPDDGPEIIRQLADLRVPEWLSAVRHPFAAADAAEILALSQDPGMHLRVVLAQGRMAGCLCLGKSPWYWLAPGFQGQGLMRRALRETLSLHFGHSAMPVAATCRADNAPSLRLLDSLGFSRLPTQRRMYFHALQASRPCVDLALTQDQWHALNQPGNG